MISNYFITNLPSISASNASQIPRKQHVTQRIAPRSCVALLRHELQNSQTNQSPSQFQRLMTDLASAAAAASCKIQTCNTSKFHRSASSSSSPSYLLGRAERRTLTVVCYTCCFHWQIFPLVVETETEKKNARIRICAIKQASSVVEQQKMHSQEHCDYDDDDDNDGH